MALTRRGKIVFAGSGAVVLVLIGFAALALTGHAPGPIQNVVDRVTGNSAAPPPPTCPLTGKPAPDGRVPQRPVVAVKVENTADAYPLAGLQNADVVYEELVEGGITRFMAVYQCRNAINVGPVRSARTTDPKVLVQFDPHAVIAYSGGQSAVVNDVRQAGLISYDETSGGGAFRRDANRAVPHNLFVNTAKVYALAAKRTAKEGPPRRLFSFSSGVPKPFKKVSGVTAPFSFSSVADWRWMPAIGRFERFYQNAPMKLDTGQPITATNVVIQQVVVTQGTLVDVLGNPSPEVALTGTGKVWILRNGKMITGVWSRPVMGAITKFQTRSGTTISLAPGNTWIELLPKGGAPVFKH